MSEIMASDEKLANWCTKHITKLEKQVDLDTSPPCHLWTGTTKRSKCGNKYGRYTYVPFDESGTPPTDTTAHRAIFMFKKTLPILVPTPEQRQAYPSIWDCSHLCHKTLCINILHISYEPRATNLQRRQCNIARCCMENHDPYPKCMFF